MIIFLTVVLTHLFTPLTLFSSCATQELGKLAECNLAEIRRSSHHRLPVFEELSPSARTLQLRTLEKHRRSHQSNDASRAMKEISKFVRQRDRSRGKPIVGDLADSK